MMKKFTIRLLIVLVLIPTISLFSQEKESNEILFFDGFSGLDFPPTGWSWIDGEQPDNWYLEETNYALGEAAPELTFRWYPEFIGTAGIKSPFISTEGNSSVYLTFNLNRGWYNTYGGYNFYLETTSDGGATWNQVWVGENPEAHIDAEEIVIFIDNSDVGSDQFQFALRFDGDASYCDAWNFDDFEVSVSDPNDVEATSIILPKLYTAGESLIPQAVITNVGSGTVSFDVNFTLLMDGTTAIYNETLSITDFSPNVVDTIDFPTWTALHGNYEAKFEVQFADDENPNNDILMDTVTVINNPSTRKIMLEMFTSSTCGPCVSGNSYLQTILNQYPETYSLVKYQMNWPGAGDPYYTAEGGVRRGYYDIYSVPALHVNSYQYNPFASFFPVEEYESYLDDISLIELEIESALIDDDNQVMISVNITPLMDYPNELTAHIVVVEKETTENTGTNGETEFDQVMMKMLPDAYGTTLNNLEEGVIINISESYDMDQTFMEEAHDLAVIVFIQENGDKYMMQSEQMDVGTNVGFSETSKNESFTMFPNPASDIIKINSGISMEHIQLINNLGQIVLEKSPNNNVLSIDVSDFENGVYFLRVMNGNHVQIKKLVID